MIKELLFSFDSPNREPYQLYGYRFGTQKPSIAIIGGFGGYSVNQLYAASRLVNFLHRKSCENPSFIKGSILVIPAVNPFGLNMNKKYWPLDNTDIDSMFPGFSEGETTQRIAAKIFEVLRGFDYGITLEGRKDMAFCMPYLKVLKTGYEDIEESKEFGFSFVHHKAVSPMDTATLAYNWQIWNTRTYSIVWGENSRVNESDTTLIKDAIIRFMAQKNIIDHPVFKGFDSNITDRDKIEVIKASHAGIFLPDVMPSSSVVKGQFLGLIRDSLDGGTLEKLYAQNDGVISCIYGSSLIFENSIAFRIVKP